MPSRQCEQPPRLQSCHFLGVTQPACNVQHTPRAPLHAQDPAKLLAAWHQLLIDPAVCLAAGACLGGLLLRTASSLVDAALDPASSQGQQLHLPAVGLALMRLLELSSALERWVWRLSACTCVGGRGDCTACSDIWRVCAYVSSSSAGS